MRRVLPWETVGRRAEVATKRWMPASDLDHVVSHSISLIAQIDIFYADLQCGPGFRDGPHLGCCLLSLDRRVQRGHQLCVGQPDNEVSNGDSKVWIRHQSNGRRYQQSGGFGT